MGMQSMERSGRWTESLHSVIGREHIMHVSPGFVHRCSFHLPIEESRALDLKALKDGLKDRHGTGKM